MCTVGGLLLAAAGAVGLSMTVLVAAVGFICGDGICDPAEDCLNCRVDCGPCPAVGACCTWDGSSVDVASQAECAALFGTYQGDGTDCLTADCTPPQGANFFLDPAAFEAALLATDKRSKASWNFKPNNLPPASGVTLDDPQNIDTHTLDPDDPWTDAAGIDLWPPNGDNVTFQSNLGPSPQPPLPNPRGFNGLAFLTPEFLDNDGNVLITTFSPDSLGIISGSPAGDNHTAMALEVFSMLGAGPGPVFVTVYDRNEQPVGKIKVDIVVNPPPGGPKKVFLGIIMKGDLTIGRVNLFDLNGGAQGISSIAVYQSTFPADIAGPLGPGFPDGCVDAIDLAVLLNAWCSGLNNPNPPSPPCENCTPANLAVADISGAANVPDGCVDAFDLAKLLAEWCSVAGGNPCGP